jgi:hypothetical protein
VLVNENSADDYLLGGWRWNESRYGIQKGVKEMTDVLNKVGRPIRTLDAMCRSLTPHPGNELYR